MWTSFSDPQSPGTHFLSHIFVTPKFLQQTCLSRTTFTVNFDKQNCFFWTYFFVWQAEHFMTPAWFFGGLVGRTDSGEAWDKLALLMDIAWQVRHCVPSVDLVALQDFALAANRN